MSISNCSRCDEIYDTDSELEAHPLTEEGLCNNCHEELRILVEKIMPYERFEELCGIVRGDKDGISNNQNSKTREE